MHMLLGGMQYKFYSPSDRQVLIPKVASAADTESGTATLARASRVGTQGRRAKREGREGGGQEGIQIIWEAPCHVSTRERVPVCLGVREGSANAIIRTRNAERLFAIRKAEPAWGSPDR